MKAAPIIALFALSALACSGEIVDRPSSESVSKLSLEADQGIAFSSGALIDTGAAPFSKADIYATANGTELKLASGGDKITAYNPVNWFVSGGGVPRSDFKTLDAVPAQKPDPESKGSPLINPKVGNGFVVKNQVDDAWTKGRIMDVSGGTVTIEWEVLP